MTNAVRLELPPRLIPVFMGDARVRGARGGRGSAKTRSFAKMTAVWALRFAQAGVSGVILCARELVKSLDESSFAEVKAAILSEEWLAQHFEVGETFIRTRRDIGLKGFVEYVFAGLRHNLASIKSKARILLCWVDEAEGVTEIAWQVLLPTLREEGEGWESELWLTWNPEREESATNQRFGDDAPGGSKIVEMNYRDNPWFPRVLERQRLEDKRKRPMSYEHIWEGAYVSYVEGAYFADLLAEAQRDGRVGNLARDPLMTMRAFWDIGGTGAKADATAIWVAQFVGRELRVLDHYEAVGQPLASHIQWLRTSGYGQALCILPHDGSSHDKVFDVSYESALRQAEFDVEVIPNQGAGAAKLRIEAARRLFPSIWFDEKRTVAGRKALGWYHEKIDPDRRIGLGPSHDWASHSADAFGLMCVAYEPPRGTMIVDDDLDMEWVA